MDSDLTVRKCCLFLRYLRPSSVSTRYDLFPRCWMTFAFRQLQPFWSGWMRTIYPGDNSARYFAFLSKYSFCLFFVFLNSFWTLSFSAGFNNSVCIGSVVLVLRFTSFWAGLDCMPCVGVFRMAYSPMYASEFALRAFSISCLAIFTAFSTFPLALGNNELDVWWLNCHCSLNARNSCDMNCGPLSVRRVVGMPWRAKLFQLPYYAPAYRWL